MRPPVDIENITDEQIDEATGVLSEYQAGKRWFVRADLLSALWVMMGLFYRMVDAGEEDRAEKERLGSIAVNEAAKYEQEVEKSKKYLKQLAQTLDANETLRERIRVLEGNVETAHKAYVAARKNVAELSDVVVSYEEQAEKVTAGVNKLTAEVAAARERCENLVQHRDDLIEERDQAKQCRDEAEAISMRVTAERNALRESNVSMKVGFQAILTIAERHS